jgi:hypothetical protein
LNSVQIRRDIQILNLFPGEPKIFFARGFLIIDHFSLFLNPLNRKKHLAVQKKYFKLLHAKNRPKIAEVKLSGCGLKVADFGKIAIAELRSNIL